MSCKLLKLIDLTENTKKAVLLKCCKKCFKLLKKVWL